MFETFTPLKVCGKSLEWRQQRDQWSERNVGSPWEADPVSTCADSQLTGLFPGLCFGTPLSPPVFQMWLIARHVYNPRQKRPEQAVHALSLCPASCSMHSTQPQEQLCPFPGAPGAALPPTRRRAELVCPPQKGIFCCLSHRFKPQEL